MNDFGMSCGAGSAIIGSTNSDGFGEIEERDVVDRGLGAGCSAAALGRRACSNDGRGAGVLPRGSNRRRGTAGPRRLSLSVRVVTLDAARAAMRWVSTRSRLRQLGKRVVSTGAAARGQWCRCRSPPRRRG